MGAERAGDLEPALLAVRQGGRELVGPLCAGPTKSSSRKASRVALALLAAGAAAAGASPPIGPVRWCDSMPILTFSIAVSALNSRMFWNVRAMPSRFTS